MSLVIECGALEAWLDGQGLYELLLHAPHHSKFLRFTFKGQAYQFKVLPFELSSVLHQMHGSSPVIYMEP